MLQLIGLGQMNSLAEIRQVVRHSFAPVVYEPEQAAAWDAAYDRFRLLLPPSLIPGWNRVLSQPSYLRTAIFSFRHLGFLWEKAASIR